MKLRHFCTSERGSVSIYFIIILSALFLFNAVLIDFARIKAAEKQAETALRAALRSTLSQFDTSLQPYGLFALSDRSNGEDMFRNILNRHVLTTRDSHEFRLTQTYWDEDKTELSFHHAISNHQVFKQQVYEEMKFRAPIEFILEVVNKFDKSGTVADMQEASTFTKLSEEIEALITQRENSLDEAWEKAGNLYGPGGSIAQLHHKYEQVLAAVNDIAGEIVLILARQALREKEKADKRSENEDADVTEDDEDDEEEEDKEAEADASRLLELIATFATKLTFTDSMIQRDYSHLSERLAQINHDLQEAKAYNEQLQESITNEENGESEGQLQETAIANYEHIIVREHNYFVQFEVEMSKVIGLFSGFKLQFENIKQKSGPEYVERYTNLVHANHAYYEKAATFYIQQKTIEDVRQAGNANLDNLKNDEIAKIADVLKKVQQLFSKCDSDDGVYYDKLQGLNDKSTVINMGDAKQIGKQSMNLFDRLGTGLLNVRNKAYFNEYALTKFNFRTTGMDASNDGIPNEGTVTSEDPHKLVNQEVEYLIYGLDSCVKNHGAAFAEIFGMRLAVRTMEALLKPEKLTLGAGSPLLLILWAVAEGSVKAYDDVKQLVEGKEVELTAKLHSITLNYKDYLRIFLLIHSTEANVITRMQALIQLNTGADLLQKATYIEGKATLSIRLWFIPGIMKLLDYKVVGRDAKITKHIVLSY